MRLSRRFSANWATLALAIIIFDLFRQAGVILRQKGDGWQFHDHVAADDQSPDDDANDDSQHLLSLCQMGLSQPAIQLIEAVEQRDQTNERNDPDKRLSPFSPSEIFLPIRDRRPHPLNKEFPVGRVAVDEVPIAYRYFASH